MQKLNRRQFERDISLTGGIYVSTKAFNLPGLLVDGVDVDTTLEEFDTAIDTNTTAIDDAAAGIVNNTASIDSLNTSMATEFQTTQNAIAALPSSDRVIYVDESGPGVPQTGTLQHPYTSLKGALEGEISQGTTDDLVFRVAPGSYVGTYTFSKNSQNQSISIVGSGSANTILKGSASWSAATADCLYLNGFTSIFISNLSIQNCKYGVYVKGSQDVVLHNVHFTRCGSDGDLTMYDFDNTKQEFDDFWSGSKTSNGGACRLRASDHVEVQNCRAELCARGLRIQDVGGSQRTSMISNNMTYNTLESGIYLASGSYTQNAADGCTNVVITGNHVYKAFNNGILSIGGRGNAIVNNVVQSCANGGIFLWHNVNTRVCNNNLDSCELISHNGVGNDGDIGGQIVVSGNGNNTTDTGYIATISGNTMVQATGVSDRGVYVEADVYPTNINKIYSSGNVTDASVAQLVDNAITIKTSEGGAFSGTADRVMVTSGTGEASASDVTVTTLSYLDVTESVDTSLQNRAKTNEATTFTDNVTVNGFLYVYNNSGNDALFQMAKQGASSTAKWEHRGSYTRMKLGSAKYHMHDDGRHSFAGQMVQVPADVNTPTASANNSKGGLWFDTSVSPGVLRFHNGVSWLTVSTS